MTRLADEGQILVTQRAAEQYADAARLGVEEARRELTVVLLDAHRVAGDTETPERWRARSRTLGIDVSARVVRQDGLLVVVGCSRRTIPCR